MKTDTGEDIPDNPIVHFVTRFGAPTAICGYDVHIVGTTYTTRKPQVTCENCIPLLP